MEVTKQKLEVLAPLNPMVFHPRFQHITKQIFKHLDNENLKNLREISISWQEFIDNRNILWNEVFKNKDCNNAFQLSCQDGLTNIARFLIKRSVHFKVNLNAKKENGKTALHLACIFEQSKIIELFNNF